jgi:hypothetical protein
MTFEIKEKLAEQLYAFGKCSGTTDLIFGIRQLIEKTWEYEKERDSDIYRL